MILKCQAVSFDSGCQGRKIHLQPNYHHSYSSSLCQAQTECWEPRLKTKFRVNPGWPPNGGTATAHLLAVGVPAVPDLVRSRSFWDMAEGDLAAEVRHEEFAISVDLNNAWRANGVILPDLATDCLQNLLKFASRTADRGYEKVCALARAAHPTQLSADLHAAVSLYLPVVASILFHVRAPNCR
jgi:hypothetical protein